MERTIAGEVVRKEEEEGHREMAVMKGQWIEEKKEWVERGK